MVRLRTLITVALVVLFASITSYADTTLFAVLTNAQENPPTHPTTSTAGFRPESFGFATFTINDAMTAMTFSATVFNIDFTVRRVPRSTTTSSRHISTVLPL